MYPFQIKSIQFWVYRAPSHPIKCKIWPCEHLIMAFGGCYRHIAVCNACPRKKRLHYLKPACSLHYLQLYYFCTDLKPVLEISLVIWHLSLHSRPRLVPKSKWGSFWQNSFHYSWSFTRGFLPVCHQYSYSLCLSNSWIEVGSILSDKGSRWESKLASITGHCSSTPPPPLQWSAGKTSHPPIVLAYHLPC